jgi:hypothetical protein
LAPAVQNRLASTGFHRPDRAAGSAKRSMKPVAKAADLHQKFTRIGEKHPILQMQQF